MFKVHINVSLKQGVADPQGITVKHALDSLGYQGVHGVAMGKYIQLELDNKNKENIAKTVEDMCAKILVNPVIEQFTFHIEEIA